MSAVVSLHNLLTPSECQPTSSVAPSLVGHGSFLRVTNDRFGLRSDRLFLPACQRLIPTPTPGLRVSGALSAPALTNYLHVFTSFQCGPQPSLTFPSREDRPPISVLQSERADFCQHHPPGRGVMNGVRPWHSLVIRHRH